MLHMKQARQKMRETTETRPKSGMTVSEEVGSILRTKRKALSQKSCPLGVAECSFSLSTRRQGQADRWKSAASLIYMSSS